MREYLFQSIERDRADIAELERRKRNIEWLIDKAERKLADKLAELTKEEQQDV